MQYPLVELKYTINSYDDCEILLLLLLLIIINNNNNNNMTYTYLHFKRVLA